MPTGTESLNGCRAQKMSTRRYQTTVANAPISATRRVANIPNTVPADPPRRCPWAATRRRYTVAFMSLRSAAAHRNLLYLLSMKELRTRYKKSILGWAWSLLNPLSQMLIFTVIFIYVFKAVPVPGDPSGLKNFPLYFLSGVLPFNFFSISVGTAIGSVQGGSSLIKKVRFPNEHLVFSVVVAQFVTLM